MDLRFLDLKKEQTHVLYLASVAIATVLVIVVFLLVNTMHTQQKFNNLENKIQAIEISLSNLTVLMQDELEKNLEKYLEESNYFEGTEDTGVSSDTDVEIESIPNPFLIIP